MKKLLTKQTVIIAAILIFLIALVAIAQSPIFRPAIGIPGTMEEMRLTTLALAQQQHAEIASQIASETASPATYVYTSDGYILFTVWLPEAETALAYWADRIAALTP